MFGTLVNPGCPITPGATGVHKITDAMVAGAPPTHVAGLAALLWLWQRCERRGGGRVVLVAHNAHFDIKSLTHLLLDGALLMPLGWHSLCTYTLVRRSAVREWFVRRGVPLAAQGDGKGKGMSPTSLSSVARAVGVAATGELHRAEADTLLLRDALRGVVARLWPGKTVSQVRATPCAL